jgi:hypothetical protein
MSRLSLTAVLALIGAAALMLRVYWPQPQTPAAPKEMAMGWRPILSQSGRGTVQTESFQIDTGQWRIKWSTAAEEAAGPEDGEFRIGVHSAVSGRLMNTAVDHRGPGEGIAYVAEEPRPFFLSIESAGLNWTLQVEEGVLGERVKNAPHPTSR